MMQSRVKVLTLLSLASFVAAACTSEKVVYRDGPNYATPVASAASFVGYSDEASKKTVCGSCHVEKQAAWQTTKHANAWTDLTASGSAAAYCNACHTVGSLGNASTDSLAGYGSTKDARYHDVQCESCHGAGLTHISGPNASNYPLASIKADTGLKNGCGECHTGVHSPFLDEWRKSGHSQTHLVTATVQTNTACQPCHVAQGILPAWGMTANYVEKAAGSPALPAVCAVCHEPHGSAYDKQLRFGLNAATLGDNLCMKCHQRRSVPDTTGNSGAHSPEGPTLVGTAGWFPPGMSASDSIYGTHANLAKNPTLCAGCHVQRFTVTDKATGKFVFQETGHRFLATPCVDANGATTDSQTCAVTSQTFRSCAVSGCHGSETAARSSFLTAQARIAADTVEARRLVNLVKLGAKKADCTATTGAYNSCRGTNFNITLAEKPGAYVHNPFLIEQLLLGSIRALKADYGVTSPPSFDMTPALIPQNRQSAALFNNPFGGSK